MLQCIRTSLSAICLIMLSQPILAESFHYKMRSVPAGTQGTCDDFAVAEAQRLGAYMKDRIGDFAIVGARCFEDEFPDSAVGWNVDIAYDSAAKIKEISTFSSGSYGAPGYVSRSACEAALAGEKSLFKSKTGIDVFAAYCRTPAFSDLPWMINVNGFGDADVIPHNTGAQVFGQILGHTQTSFKDMVASQLQKHGSVLAQFSLRGSAMNQMLGIRYYGSKVIRIEETKLATFNTQDSCANEVESAAQALDRIGTTNVGVYCQNHALGSGVELISMTNQQENLSISRTGQVFTTFSACQDARDSVVNHYNNDLGRHIELALCSLGNSRKLFDMMLLEKK